MQLCLVGRLASWVANKIYKLFAGKFEQLLEPWIMYTSGGAYIYVIVRTKVPIVS